MGLDRAADEIISKLEGSLPHYSRKYFDNYFKKKQTYLSPIQKAKT